MKFDIFHEIPAEIREQKLLNYTLTPIGGPEEYKAYLEQKAIRLEARRQAQEEAYLLRRAFAQEIIAGRAKASPEALKVSPTLARFQQQYGASEAPKTNVELISHEAKIEPVKWYQRIAKMFEL
jgi:hypothetical protein